MNALQEISNRFFSKYINGCKMMPNKLYIVWRYYNRFGYIMNLNNPKTYNEKLQWLKLYDHNPMYTDMADKYKVKKIVSEKVGEEYVIPLYGVWNSFDEIDFSKLPEQFVLKCTHDSGGIYICRNKEELNINEARDVIEKSLGINYYYYGREWVYKNVKPRIIAEQYLEENNELTDYKFFCFQGEPKILYVATERMNSVDGVKFDFYDMSFNNLHIKNNHPNSNKLIPKPKSFEKMKELSRILSEGIPHVRVDFYEINGKPLFGEFTFYSNCGLDPFEPEYWDITLGEWIDLNSVTSKPN